MLVLSDAFYLFEVVKVSDKVKFGLRINDPEVSIGRDTKVVGHVTVLPGILVISVALAPDVVVPDWAGRKAYKIGVKRCQPGSK
jgi:hypothetical protein